MKKSIEISPNLETLFGTRDENLHVLEDGLNINIDLRSDHIDLEGAPRDVARAEQLFADILDPNTGEPVLVRGTTVLVMPAYRHAAHRVFSAAELTFTAAGSTTATVAANPLSGAS